MDTPLLLIVFNRPDAARAVIESLRGTRPSKLYIAADGPRAGVPGEAERCQDARAAAQAVDWPCDVRTLFSDVNRGVDPAVELAIDWFFEHEEAGIILEDDCIPHPDFFRFSSVLLDRYREESHVMMISGDNFQGGRCYGDGSYYFSRYPSIWGWATWRRAWKRYDRTLAGLPAFERRHAIESIIPSASEQRYWLRFFRSLRSGRRTAWDAKWVFSVWDADGVCVTPNVNLVQNIGFGENATHTTSGAGLWSIPAMPLLGDMAHPASRAIARGADERLFKAVYAVTLRKRIDQIRHGMRAMRAAVFGL
jgi:hypothetical protein